MIYKHQSGDGSVIDILNRVWYNAVEVMGLPRAARVRARSGIYHVMLRGINKQNIFEEDEDYEKMIDLLRRSMDISGAYEGKER